MKRLRGGFSTTSVLCDTSVVNKWALCLVCGCGACQQTGKQNERPCRRYVGVCHEVTALPVHSLTQEQAIKLNFFLSKGRNIKGFVVKRATFRVCKVVIVTSIGGSSPSHPGRRIWSTPSHIYVQIYSLPWKKLFWWTLYSRQLWSYRCTPTLLLALRNLTYWIVRKLTMLSWILYVCRLYYRGYRILWLSACDTFVCMFHQFPTLCFELEQIWDHIYNIIVY